MTTGYDVSIDRDDEGRPVRMGFSRPRGEAGAIPEHYVAPVSPVRVHGAVGAAPCETCGDPIPDKPVRKDRRHCKPACRAKAYHARKGQVPLDFNPPGQPIPPVNPSVAPEARKRLQASAVRILERLRRAPATNAELLPIGGFRYGARLGEVREHLRWLHGRGRDWDPITCVEDKTSGLAVYTLFEEA